MVDRAPTKPNRYAVYDENHNFIRYEYHERADEPTQVGDALNKANLLPDAVATALGLTGNPQVKDALAAVRGYLASRGLIKIIAVDTQGNPFPNATFSISPTITNFSTVTTNAFGECYIGCDFGNYTLTPTTSSIFVSIAPTSKALTVAPGTIAVANFTVTKNLTGRAVLTTGTTIVIPAWVSKVDLFAVGGGGGRSTSNNAGCGTGGCGGGGYAATLLDRAVVANDEIDIIIGAAGASSDSNGGTGGTTIVKQNGTTILTANGGKGGKSTSTTTGGAGGDGGSGGGGGQGFNTIMGSDGAYGSNGGNGGTGRSGSGPGGPGGNGQGTTTKEFGEADGALYSYGGGGDTPPSAYGNGEGTAAANQGCVVIRW